MNNFSAAWIKYLILYDEKVRNAKFSEDFKGTAAYIRQFYNQLATELGLTVDEVQKCQIKYIDAVTKGLAQLGQDLDNGTMCCPIPAIHKLRLFRWLWPHSKNYDKECMQNISFDDYMERALVVEVNRLTHEKRI